EAAGIASVAKTILSLNHREIPPSLHFETPNPRIDFDESPFFVNASLAPWEGPRPLRAGVTALGAGGTNAHLVFEEAPPASPSEPRRGRQILCLSARTGEALDAAATGLAAHLASHPETSLADAAYTLQVGRKGFAKRRTLVASTREEAIAALSGADATRLLDDAAEGNPSVVFMFPGGGAQHAGMARELYAKEPRFREELERCLAVLAPLIGRDLKPLLMGDGGSASEAERPSIALPALFTVEWALARTLMAWGIRPAALIGHSMGEYVAACLAGVVTLEDALALVTKRGRLFETLPAGGMLAVPLSARELVPLLPAGLSVAADNAPSLCVASGPLGALEALERTLADRGVEATRVHISVAAHSSMLEPILGEFELFCRGLTFRPPRIPYVSNLTGAFIRDEEATDPAYWARHLRGTVRFADGLAALLTHPRVLVEVGPGRTLSSLARMNPGSTRVIATARHPKESGAEDEVFLSALARLWAAGCDVDWSAFHHGEKLRRVPLPTYPFQRKRYFLEAGDPLAGAPRERGLEKKRDMADWFLAPIWKKAPAPAGSPESRRRERWLVFLDETGLMSRLVQRLRVEGAIPREIHTVSAGERWHESGGAGGAGRHFTIDPLEADDYRKLTAVLELPARGLDRIVHAWNVTAPGSPSAEWASYEPFAWRSLLFLAQALGAGETPPFTLVVLSNQLQRVGADEDLVPEKAALLGPCRVLPREIAGASARSVDVALFSPGSWQDTRLLDQLLPELAYGTEATVAWRGPDRLVETLEPLPLGPAGAVPVRDGGVYLVTGGFGGLGLTVARWLASRARVRLVLLGRGAHGEAAARRIAELEAAGAEVLAASADVASRSEMQAAFARAKARFGRIDGLVHAAGVLDDALVQLKTPEAAAAVLAPKISGTLVLDELLRHESLDFFVLFSSVSARLGPPGQIDYAAANAFLEAFAEAKSARDGTPTVAVAWGPWRRVGMAARLAKERGAAERPRAPREPGSHPFVAAPLADGPEEARFAIPLARANDWIVGEHVVAGGEAVLPGTAYLELARAGFEASMPRADGAALEMRDVVFQSPFVVPRGEERELLLKIDKRRGEFSFTSAEETHAEGKIAWVPKRGVRSEPLD
ncbi:MAG TPA: type I polyketide synthase, partial [Thermoanaerobaculia bacterium]|nr:type I polyketide synthase [Thermoanaerobaculia bacterium]